MFCNQCEQTAKGIACDALGVCGKNNEVATLQDATVFAIRGLSLAAHKALEKGITDNTSNALAVKALFSTLTNVNFDSTYFVTLIKELITARKQLADKSGFSCGCAVMTFEPASSVSGIIAEAAKYSTRQLNPNADINSLQQTLLYGLKGLAAYADHAEILGKTDPAVYAFFHKAMIAGFDKQERTLQDWIGLVLECGTVNLRVMELLDAANTETYGHPEPTKVPLGHRKGKCILVSGHDLKDLHTLLEQTKDKGIFIYTHGEMLPTHAYPKLKAYPHFYGHFGTAWQNQHKEFPLFPGAILFTTNCIQKPSDATMDRIFTTGLVGWPGVKHVPNNDFSAVIEKALSMPGFPSDEAGKEVMAGFARNSVLAHAETIIGAVKSGAIKHFFLVGGCDGAKPGRNYYTEFVEKTPKDTIILTLACGKFRFFDKDLGSIGGIPRLLDMGQCNDAYSAIQVALALSKAFNCEVNDLPLSLVLSWYEQKAVVILLTLLSLGIKNVRLGPTLPAFITPNVLQVLVDNFAIKPITTPDEDLKAILG